MAEVPITQSELNRGWYMSTEKKPATPSNWVFTTFRGMSTWGDCDKMKQANAEPVCSRIGGATGSTVCKQLPMPDCKPPSWVGQFKNKWGLFEFIKWQGSKDLPFRQRVGLYKKEIMIGGVLVSGALLAVMVTIALRKKKSKKTEKKYSAAGTILMVVQEIASTPEGRATLMKLYNSKPDMLIRRGFSKGQAKLLKNLAKKVGGKTGERIEKVSDAPVKFSKKDEKNLELMLNTLGSKEGASATGVIMKKAPRKPKRIGAFEEEEILSRREARKIWKEMLYTDRRDILEEADIDDSKKLARMCWHRLIKEELRKSEADRLMAELGGFGAWKFTAPKRKHRPVALIDQIGDVLTEVVGWKEPKRKIRHLPKEMGTGRPSTYQVRVKNKYAEDVAVGLTGIKHIRFYPTTVGDETVFDIISQDLVMPPLPRSVAEVSYSD